MSRLAVEGGHVCPPQKTIHRVIAFTSKAMGHPLPAGRADAITPRPGAEPSAAPPTAACLALTPAARTPACPGPLTPGPCPIPPGVREGSFPAE